MHGKEPNRRESATILLLSSPAGEYFAFEKVIKSSWLYHSNSQELKQWASREKFGPDATSAMPLRVLGLSL